MDDRPVPKGFCTYRYMRLPLKFMGASANAAVVPAPSPICRSQSNYLLSIA